MLNALCALVLIKGDGWDSQSLHDSPSVQGTREATLLPSGPAEAGEDTGGVAASADRGRTPLPHSGAGVAADAAEPDTKSEHSEGHGLEPPDKTTNAESKSKPFRFNAHNLFLTYPNVPCGAYCRPAEWYARVAACLSADQRESIKSWVCGRERHGNGTHHFHLAIGFNQRPDVRRSDFVDVPCTMGCNPAAYHHPNIRVIQRGGVQRVHEYCIKDGDFAEWQTDLFPSSAGFRNRYSDLAAWAVHRQQRGRSEPEWPIRLPGAETKEGKEAPCTYQVREPLASDRRRIIFITGKPGAGKSRWINAAFGGSRVYMRPTGTDEQVINHPFDSYEGEQVIIYDDVLPFPSIGELIRLCNVWNVFMAVPGNTRYRVRYLPLHQPRLILLVYNSVNQCPYVRDERFTSRTWFVKFPNTAAIAS